MNKRKGGSPMSPRKILSPALALCLLLGGCAGAAEEASSQSMALAEETVSGIITQVNGNEITLDLVTLASAGPGGGENAAPAEGGEAPEGEAPSGEELPEMPEGGDFSGMSGGELPEMPEGGDFSGMFGGEMPEMPEGGDFSEMFGGELPSGGGMTSGGGGAGRSYTRTGESATYQIPIGAEVVTLTGASRDFHSLSTELLVTISFREDGVTPARVQVVQSLS